MSTDAAVGAASSRLRRALPVLAAVSGAGMTVALTRVLPVEVVAAGVLGVVAVLVVRANPWGMLALLAVSRAVIETLTTRVIFRPFGIGLSPTDVLSLAFLGGAAWWLASEAWSGNRFWRSPMVGPALVLVGVSAVSLTYSPDAALGARDLLKWSAGFCAYLVVLAACPDPRRLRLLLGLVVLSAVVPLLVALWHLANGIGRPNLLHGGLRIQATFDHPNTFGFYLVSVLVAVWGLRPSLSPARRRFVDAIGLGAFVFTLFTLSRTAWGALTLVALVVGWRSFRVMFSLVLVGGGVVAAAPRLVERALDLVRPREGANRGNSLLGRLEVWSGEIQTWSERPFLGHGWGYTLSSRQDQASHNDYLRMMVEAGLVGLLAMVALMVSLLRHSWRAACNRDDLPLAFLGLTLGYLLQSAVSNNMGKGVYQFYFWLLAGISFAWAERVPPRLSRSRASTARAAAAGVP